MNTQWNGLPFYPNNFGYPNGMGQQVMPASIVPTNGQKVIQRRPTDGPIHLNGQTVQQNGQQPTQTTSTRQAIGDMLSDVRRDVEGARAMNNIVMEGGRSRKSKSKYYRKYSLDDSSSSITLTSSSEPIRLDDTTPSSEESEISLSSSSDPIEADPDVHLIEVGRQYGGKSKKGSRKESKKKMTVKKSSRKTSRRKTSSTMKGGKGSNSFISDMNKIRVYIEEKLKLKSGPAMFATASQILKDNGRKVDAAKSYIDKHPNEVKAMYERRGREIAQNRAESKKKKAADKAAGIEPKKRRSRKKSKKDT